MERHKSVNRGDSFDIDATVTTSACYLDLNESRLSQHALNQPLESSRAQTKSLANSFSISVTVAVPPNSLSACRSGLNSSWHYGMTAASTFMLAFLCAVQHTSPSTQYRSQSDPGSQQRPPKTEHDQTSPRGPAIHAVIGCSLGVRDLAPASRRLRPSPVSNSPLQARSGREAFL